DALPILAGVVDLQLVAEVHRDPLLAPAAIHLVVGPQGGAEIAAARAVVVDAAAEHAAAQVPVRRRAPVVVHAQHRGLTAEERPVHARKHHAEVVVLEVLYQAQRMEAAPGLAGLVCGKHTVLHATDAAVDLGRGRDVAGAAIVIGRPAHATGIEQLAGIRRRGVFEDALVLGE